ncbi:TetR/AcrR family transcriptional regulator [Saccharopolyspora gloriosae]|uniref:TetR/AcrR family transcriptional regulator n=1 Tax=Saccharopolyspora gloriosae TaxID=455344 RepID=UPI001FB69551|nr:TetR/AcrR family transcriptional regulator [Saccharopolyspora gloriosae]
MLTPQRTDARRNREIILRAADEAFAQGSELVPIEEIARRTGLGRATVYRHFPDRYALARTVAAHRLDTLKRVVASAERDHRTFRDLLHVVLSDQVVSRPLVNLIRELPEHDQRRYANSLIAVLAPAFRRAQAREQLRDDIEPADLMLILEMIEGALSSKLVPADDETAVRKLIAVTLDGLYPRLDTTA